MPILGKVFAAIALILLLAVVAAPAWLMLAAFYGAQALHWQPVWVEVQVVEEDGPPAGSALVAVFELVDGGPKLITEGRADASGLYKFIARVPKRLVAELEGGTKVYAPISIWVVASRGDGLLGTLTQPLDPSTMKQPSDAVRFRLPVKRVRQSAEAKTSSAYHLTPATETAWAWTSALQFSTWDNISAVYEFPIGTRVIVQSKERWWSGATCSYLTNWFDAGAAIVTFDHGIRAAD